MTSPSKAAQQPATPSKSPEVGKAPCPLDEEDPSEMTTSSSSVHGKMPKAPDGGWGWAVVFASFMIHVIADGVTYTFGIFYVELLKYFGASKASTAWIASIMTGTTYCVGPIASGLTNRYGCRAVAVAGSLLATFGLLTSLIAPDIMTMCFTIGICTGTGFGLMYLPAIVSVTMYFEKRRAFATGVAVCGSGIGSAVLAPIIEYLIHLYGWKGAMAIVGGLVLCCTVFGAMFRPLLAGADDEEDPSTNQVSVTEELSQPSPKSKTKNHDELFEQYNGHLPSSLEKKALSLQNHHEMGITLEEAVNEDMDETRSSLVPCAGSIMGTSCPESGQQPQIHYLRNDNHQHNQHRHSHNHLNHHHHNDRHASDHHRPSLKSYYSLGVPCKDVHQEPSPATEYLLRSGGPHRRRSSSLTPGILARKDIFYSGSLLNIPQYRSNPALYSTSMTSIPSKCGHHHDQIRRSKRKMFLFRFLNCSKEMTDALIEMMDFNILADVIFMMFAVSNFLTSIGFFVPNIYMKDRVLVEKIADESDASLLLAVIGIGSTVGRVVFGFISDHAFVNRLALYNWSLTVCGVATALSSCHKTYSFMLFYCLTFGLSCGVYVSLTSVILVDLLGIERLTNAFGLLLLFQGVASLIGPPIIGWIYDYSGSYDSGFYVAGSMIAISGVMLFFIPCIQRHLDRREEEARLGKTIDPPIIVESTATSYNLKKSNLSSDFIRAPCETREV